MLLKEALLTLLLGLRPAVADAGEAFEDRVLRMTTIRDAVVQVSEEFTEGEKPMWHGSARKLEVVLLTIGYEETSFMLRIHAGQCLPHECDSHQTANGLAFRARSPWQVHRSPLTEKEWPLIKGADFESTVLGARAAARVMAYSLNHCHSLRGAFSLYATGKSCKWTGSAERVRFYLQLERKLDAIIREEPCTASSS